MPQIEENIVGYFKNFPRLHGVLKYGFSKKSLEITAGRVENFLKINKQGHPSILDLRVSLLRVYQLRGETAVYTRKPNETNHAVRLIRTWQTVNKKVYIFEV